ncbi:MAG: hypothetical protein DRQ98_13850 [Gammaproteobacteria bacterium]|nr:MAG: hypothetical protein DRQ98_13850 [Gammaproteobacteria bacterium]
MTSTAHENLTDQEFLDDLIDDKELAQILRVQPQSISVMRSRGQIPIPTYKRGRKTLSSRRGAVEYIKASLKPHCG